MSSPPPLDSDSPPPDGHSLPEPPTVILDPSQISIYERVLDSTTGALLADRVIKIPMLHKQHSIRHHPYQPVRREQSPTSDNASRNSTEQVDRPEASTQSPNEQILPVLIENELGEDTTAGTTNQQPAHQQHPQPQNLQGEHELGNQQEVEQSVESVSRRIPVRSRQYFIDRRRRRRRRAINRSALNHIRAQSQTQDGATGQSNGAATPPLHQPSHHGNMASSPATTANGDTSQGVSQVVESTEMSAIASITGGTNSTDSTVGGPTAIVSTAGGPSGTTSIDGAPMATVDVAGVPSGSNMAITNKDIDRNAYTLAMPLPNDGNTHQRLLEIAQRLSIPDRPPKRNGSINAFFMLMPFSKFFDARGYLEKHLKVPTGNWTLMETRRSLLEFSDSDYIKFYRVKIEKSRDSPISSHLTPWHSVFGYTAIRSRRFLLYHALSITELVRLVCLATYLEVCPNCRLSMPNDHRVAVGQVGLILKAFRNRLTQARVLEVFSEDGQKVVKNEMSQLGWHESDEEEDSD